MKELRADVDFAAYSQQREAYEKASRMLGESCESCCGGRVEKTQGAEDALRSAQACRAAAIQFSPHPAHSSLQPAV